MDLVMISKYFKFHVDDFKNVIMGYKVVHLSSCMTRSKASQQIAQLCLPKQAKISKKKILFLKISVITNRIQKLIEAFKV
jgi:hypothetical protein